MDRLIMRKWHYLKVAKSSISSKFYSRAMLSWFCKVFVKTRFSAIKTFSCTQFKSFLEKDKMNCFDVKFSLLIFKWIINVVKLQSVTSVIWYTTLHHQYQPLTFSFMIYIQSFLDAKVVSTLRDFGIRVATSYSGYQD